MYRRLLSVPVLVLGLAICELSPAAPHPYHDDGGAINWRPTWAAAIDLSKKTGKPLFILTDKEEDAVSKKFVSEVLTEKRVSQLINHYFVPVAFELEKVPKEVRPNTQKASKFLPVVVIMNDRGAYITGFGGLIKPNEVEDALLKVLQDKAYTIPKTSEATMAKQLEALDKALDDKAYSKATPIFQNIVKTKGYSELKDKAYEKMDSAQSEATQELTEAYSSVRQDDYPEAKKAIEKVMKGYIGLPVAEQAKEQLAAVKLLESAYQLSSDPKVPRKADAMQKLDLLLRTYIDTPYASLAQFRKKELMPMPKTK
jgi:hypothetical protein